MTAGGGAPAPAAISRSAPELTSFVGRAQDLDALRDAFARGESLVTVLGPPGMGKTRLARRFSAAVRDTCPGSPGAPWESGPWFCDLTPAQDADEVAAVVGRAVGVAPDGLSRALSTCGRALLVLDNVEHLPPDAAALVSVWLAAAPELAVLVTSREVLRIPGEHVHELPALPEAEDLFIARAADVRPGYQPGAEERRLITAIVARLQAVPLAVELCAARMRVLSPADILARLDRRLELLATAPGGVSARHATMRDAVAWSWDLLLPHEQAALARVSVFRGGFTPAAAERVVGPTAPGAPPLTDVLRSLREKSLLWHAPTTPGAEVRFGMFECIRAFAAERLAERDAQDERAARRRHARFYLDAIGALEEVERPGLAPAQLYAPLAADIGNLQLILEEAPSAFADGPERVEATLLAAVVLDALSDTNGLTPFQLRCLDAGIAAAPLDVSRSLLGRAHLARSLTLSNLTRDEEAAGDARRALALAGEAGHDRLASAAAQRLGQVLYMLGRFDEVVAATLAARDIAARIGDRAGEIRAAHQELAFLCSIGRGDEAAPALRALLPEMAAVGFHAGEARGNLALGLHALERGRPDEAREHMESALAVSRERGIRRAALLATGYLGVVDFAAGRLVDASLRVEAAVAEAREVGDGRLEGFFLCALGALHAALGALPAAERASGTGAALLRRYEMWLAVTRLFEGHLDLARSRRAHADGDPTAGRRHLEAARARIDAARAPGIAGRAITNWSDDARIALLLLEKAIARTTEEAATREVVPLVVPRDAAWFQLGNAAPVDLARRPVLRCLLAALCDREERSPGAPLSIEELLAAGWPNERTRRSAALNRLHFSLSSLRSLGLGDSLERQGTGYRLAPHIRLRRPGDEPV